MESPDFDEFAIDWIQERASAGDLLAMPGVFERAVSYYGRQLQQDYDNYCRRLQDEQMLHRFGGSQVSVTSAIKAAPADPQESPVYSVHQERRNGNIYFKVHATLTADQAQDCQRVAGYHCGGYGFYGYRTADGITSWHCAATAD